MKKEVYKILVTGASGTIGTHLINNLLLRGHEVIAVGRSEFTRTGVRQVVVSDYEAGTLVKALKGIAVDGIIHLAAMATKPGDWDDVEVAEVNAILPVKIVEVAGALNVRAVLVAGTNQEYADTGQTLRLSEDMCIGYSNLYGTTKAAGGLLALLAGKNNNVPVAVARVFNVYGPGDHPRKLLPSLSKTLLNGEIAKLSSGKQLKDFIHIYDVCDGMASILEALLNGRADTGYYNVCTGVATSLIQFAEAVAEVVGAEKDQLGIGLIPDRIGEPLYSVGDPEKTKNVCGWTYSIELRDGIRSTLFDD